MTTNDNKISQVVSIVDGKEIPLGLPTGDQNSIICQIKIAEQGGKRAYDSERTYQNGRREELKNKSARKTQGIESAIEISEPL